MNAPDAAAQLVERVRARPWGLATVAISGDDTSFAIDPGDDPMSEDSLFQIGSITKTMTGLLLADSIVRDEVTAATTIGELLPVQGAAAAITLEQLATQRSGLPRLPPNLDLATIDQRDPYAAFSRDDLLVALNTVDLGEPAYLYSNFGFMTLGQCVTAATSSHLTELYASRIFDPIAMATAGYPASESGRVPGYAGAAETPWWSSPLAGSGGVGATIRDMAAYLRAHVDVPTGILGSAIELATTVHAGPPDPLGYGWGHQGGGWWHNGGTGGFSSFAAFHRPTRTAVALLANCAPNGALDGVGFAVLTSMVNAAI